MTMTIPENDNVQLGPASSYPSKEFERLSLNTTEHVTQNQKPFVYTNSNIILKPDDILSPTETASPTITSHSPRLNERQSPSFQHARPIQYSPSFQNTRPMQYSPSFRQSSPQYNNGSPQINNSNNNNMSNGMHNVPLQPNHQQPMGMPQQRGYNVSRQPSTFYAERPSQFQYRPGAPLPPQPMSPTQQQLNPNNFQQQHNPKFRPPPPPPSHTYNNGYNNLQPRPMMPPPPSQLPQMFGHTNNSASTVVTPLDNTYLADSSLSVANSAGKRPKQSKFPPVTKENLAMYRNEAQSSNDPRAILDLAKFLLEAVNQLAVDEQDPKRTKKTREAMLMEAQKICKKLAAHSGMGKQGYPEAQFFLANCYGSGTMGLQTDPDKAFSLYIQGSKQSHPGCTFRAAVCYEVGAGTKRDKNHAIQFYRKAANLGDSVAMYKLGMILLKGFLGQPKNPREGISWLKRASQQVDEDHPHALHELGLAYEKEGIPSVIPDLNYARELFTQAAQYGYAPSQFKLGLAYENGFLNCPVDPRRSIAWYSKAAEQGDIEAEFALSGWYLTGAEGVLPQSDSEAYLWARKAADKGNAKAEYAVGYYTETGTGTRQSLEEAKRWYMRAAAQNYRRAMQRLTELKYGGARPQQRRKHTREANNTSSNSKDSECIVM
ncbi:hypothetical protein BDF21DRAFT_418500 [Thamnidium elegans]|nr:hypothetical protein BDF21DRAFT_418500 [Thamnidium elegans]